MDDQKFQTSLVSRLQWDITEEIFKAIKFPQNKTLRNIFRPLTRIPTRNFSELMAELDGIVRRAGFVEAARRGLSYFVRGTKADGLEGIPRTGPLIIASNHPGTYDAFTIISNLPREDVKLVVSGIPFFADLPNTREHFIYATRDTQDRADALRKSIRHLSAGGALLIFPSGRIDPDPAVLPEASENLGRWSRSLEVFLKKVQQTRLVLAITSGVLSTEFLNHPFVRLFKNDHERRRVVEFMQVIRQMIAKKPLALQPKVSFSAPLAPAVISSGSSQAAIADIVGDARQLLNAHLRHYYF